MNMGYPANDRQISLRRHCHSLAACFYQLGQDGDSEKGSENHMLVGQKHFDDNTRSLA